jgi:plastocyanin
MRIIKDRRFSFRPSTLALAFAFLAPAWASAATIHGATDAAVVWIGSLPSLVKASDLEMRNRERTFIPPFIVVPVGSSIRFPNDDPFYHSIYSDSKIDPFDIGYYGPGPGKSVVFDNPGVVNVHCHIHASMHATIIVADGPYAVAAGGTYSLTNVPAGKYTLHSWTPGSDERATSVTVPNANADVTLDVRR